MTKPIRLMPSALERYRIKLNSYGNAIVVDTLPFEVDRILVTQRTLEGEERVYLPKRPQSQTKPTLLKRLALAYDVFIGNADALYWPRQ